MGDIVLFGPPGCGKGTQAKRIGSYRHVSTGDLFRSAVAEQSEIGKRITGLLGTGQLIPDEITLEMVEGVCMGAQPVIWDGFPRTVPQAYALEVMLERTHRKISHVFNLAVPDEVLLERIIGRYETSKREDDNPESFAVRLATYYKKTQPVLDHYTGRVITIDGTQSPDAIAEYIKRMLP